jgi:ATP-dependent DNA helicase RecG
VSNAASSLSADELRALLQRDEGQFLEFKSLWDREGDSPRRLERRVVRDKIANVVAAFANADGGTLILGVEDDGMPTGHDYPEEAIDGFLAVPAKRLRPAMPCRTQRMTLEGHDLLVLEVPMSAEAVMVEGNGFPYRIGDQVRREPQEVINARKEAYRTVGYEQRFRPEASIEALDLDLVQRFLAGTPLAARAPEEILQQFGLIQPRSGGFGVTNAALLLFGRPPLSRWHPRAGLRFFRVQGIERRHGTRRNVTQGARIELPLAEAIAEAHRLASQQIGRSEKLHDLFFRETPEYPGFAWQEAIVNAFAHRDYEIQGQEIEVWFFADRMEVKSPGELVPPVTLKALRNRRPVHASRNPLLVRVLAEAGLMREEGEGVPRMFEEMHESFLRAPQLGLADAVFTVTLRNEPIFSGPSPEWKSLVDALPLTLPQKRALLAHPEGFSNGDYQTLNHVDRDEAYRQIQEMVVRGVVQAAEKPGRGATYRIAEDLSEQRAFLDQRVPELRQFFTSEERLKNADYRELFGLTRYASVRELRQLVEQGFLRMEGERRGSHYRALPPLLEPQE